MSDGPKTGLYLLLKGGEDNITTLIKLGPFESVQLTRNGDVRANGKIIVYHFVRPQKAPMGSSYAYDRGRKDRVWAREVEVVTK